MELADELRATAKKLLEEGKIDLFIGHEKGTLPLHTRPCFVNGAGDTERLIWDAFCSNNLAVYLPRLFSKQHRPRDWKPPRVGIVAKGCDGRSIVGLIKEKQVPRENVIILGVPCSGIVDLRKLEAALNGATPVGAELSGEGSVTVHTDAGKDIQLSRDEVLLDSCADCLYMDSPVFDMHVGPKSSPPGTKLSFKDVEDFESKSPQERWQYFVDEMSKCIRCYACRQACPNCYCPTCFAEQTLPKWLGVSTDISEVMYYQLGRIFHQAGRCVDCGACVRACPMNIDLRVFTRKMVKDIQELFGYEAGISLDEPLPLRTFTMEDDESFITEP